MTSFDYKTAFLRNIGLLTEEEQETLRTFTIAIPGMGGVGGIHLLSLVRQGFEKFHIADRDSFELKNFNRQAGARMSTIGRQKVEVIKEDALAINPQCAIEVFDAGISDENLDAFLEGVDLAVDALDAFEVDIRRKFFNRALARGIPVIAAGPIGFSTAFLIFLPGGPTFDDYFAMKEDMPFLRKMLLFAIGLTPKFLQRPYMRGVDIKEKRGPSSIGAINLCAGIIAIYALKVLLKKGPIRAVPYYHQFDVMRDRYVIGRLRWGNKGLIQRLKLMVAQHLLK